ncbi:TPA: DNA cytosine methyltransferase [Streptococcus suis]|nr:DNA cytosine methyltransferase [Streptococcus suis]HEM3666841.1 DNA cytosine methyltransferase [Streptococcus suis]HEM3720817.1 DNA cytosine methyltransferase [Streptococcus suis]
MINVVDLFSGAGGLTFGFKKKIEGFSFIDRDDFMIKFANEYNKDAAEAFRRNYPDIPMIEEDIAKIDKKYLMEKEVDIENIDLLIGGPPCQSYSTVGKRQYDNRAKMYREYRRLLSILQPKMFVFENVTGLLSMKNSQNDPIIKDIEESFRDLSEFTDSIGYKIYNKVLNAKDFGVPQNRARVFLVGIRMDLNPEVKWEFPTGDFVDKEVTLREAISDLPKLNNNDFCGEYLEEPSSDYQKLMRGNCKTLYNHISRNHGERLIKIMSALGEGQGKNDINKMVEDGLLSEDLYLTSGYSNTYGRLWWDKPSTTITNSLSSPSSLRCIHPSQDRALTAREGARIQSFPDDYQFVGGLQSVNMQIGNAVPPILSVYLANRISEFFRQNNM